MALKAAALRLCSLKSNGIGCYKFFEHLHGRDMEQEKTNLATLAVIIKSSVAPIGNQNDSI